MGNSASVLSKKLAARISCCLVFPAGAAVCEPRPLEQSRRLHCKRGSERQLPLYYTGTAKEGRGEGRRDGGKRGEERSAADKDLKLRETHWEGGKEKDGSGTEER